MKKILVIGLVMLLVIFVVSMVGFGMERLCGPNPGTVTDVCWGRGRLMNITFQVKDGLGKVHNIVEVLTWYEGDESPNDVSLGRADQWEPV